MVVLMRACIVKKHTALYTIDWVTIERAFVQIKMRFPILAVLANFRCFPYKIR